jgi:hypothetical protein
MNDLMRVMKTTNETLTRSRKLVAEAIALRARSRELRAATRRQLEDHRYLLSWALSCELVSERSAGSRLDDAAIRDFARYRLEASPWLRLPQVEVDGMPWVGILGLDQAP